MALTELQIKAAKRKERTYVLSDGRGLILDVHPNGNKYWIVRIWSDGKEKRRSLGSWPQISLKKAREMNYELRKGPQTSGVLFGSIAQEWLEKIMIPRVSDSYAHGLKLRLNKHILPKLAQTDIELITPKTILSVCRAIEDDGHYETAKKIRIIISQVFNYAIATDRATNNPAITISGALQPYKIKHYPTIYGAENIGLLMRHIDAYPQKTVRCAMLLSALTFCRPGEIRRAEWNEVDFSSQCWTIPAEKMKMRVEHFVPLSKQALAVFESMEKASGDKKYIFPSARNDKRSISDATVRMALHTMGYTKDQFVPHGFRAMASTVLNEYGWTPDVIEAQLSHGDTNKIRSAYNRAAYKTARTVMMQWWADYLDAARAGLPAPEKPAITVTI